MSKYDGFRSVTLRVGVEGEDAFYIQDRKFQIHDYLGPHKLRIVHDGPGVRQILVVTNQNWTDLPGGLKVMSDDGAKPGEVILVTQGQEAWPLLTEAARAAQGTAKTIDRSLDGPR